MIAPKETRKHHRHVFKRTATTLEHDFRLGQQVFIAIQAYLLMRYVKMVPL